ncbi:bleomycin resistance family protein [Flavobacterium silvisoli]|uniref:Bleomycin resistance family protein n=1 Tax=Flavobacterium silvisoli TaxID=2529433 RepID=A0A4Q9Z6J4_9FLAO|nr:VOC family protein [Flavobacterium silvisoli]TBX70209.1 bleomycin resistance family protein [Flavobacterium silvisoli]
MKFHHITPIIWTEQLQETIDFYCNVLGFRCGECSDEWQWAALFNDECELMIAKPNEHTPFEKPAFTGSFYIKVDDVETLWNQLRHDVNVVYELETFDWGMREFAIYDNNGYMLQFGQDINK